MQLTTKEQQRLTTLESIVRENEFGMLKWAKALWEIKQTGFWKSVCESWPEYCSNAFGYSRSKAYAWIAAVEFVEHQKLIAETTGEPTEVPRTIKRALALKRTSPTGGRKIVTITDNNPTLLPMSAKHDQNGPPIHFAKPPAPPRDIRELMGAMEKDMDALLHRQDIPYDALRIIFKLGSELKQARTLLQGVLPGMEEVVSKPRFRKPSLEDVQLFCEKSKINGRDAEWFWNKMEGNGWKNGGKPVVDWQRTLTAWKLAGHLPSQRVVNGNGRYGANGQPVKSIVEQDIDRMRAQVDRL